MKSLRLFFSVLVVCGYFLSGALFAARLFDRIIVEVGNKVMTMNEVKLAVEAQKQQRVLQNLPPVDEEQAISEIINGKVGDLLLEIEAERLRIQVSQGELDNEVSRYKKRIGKSESDTLEDILKYLNTTSIDFKTNIYNVILRNKLIGAEVYSKIDVSDEHLKAVYEKSGENNYTFQIRHILRKIPPAADDEGKKKAKKDILYIQDKLSKDLSQWNTLALTYSDDPSVKTNNGVLAPFQKNQIIKELSEPVSKMTVGEIVGPVETPFGYHIIELLDKSLAQANNFSEVKNELQQTERTKQYKIHLDRLIEKLRKKYTVRALDPAYRKYIQITTVQRLTEQ